MPVSLVFPFTFGSQAGPTIPVSEIDDNFAAAKAAINGLVPTLIEFNAAATPRLYLSGLTLSNSVGDPTNDIDIAIGTARDSTNVNTMPFASAYTKQLDAAWALGTAAGMRDTGAISNATWHIFLIMRTDTLTVDVLASLSPTAPTMPANYTLFRRIGSIVRSGGAIKTFVQDGDSFQWLALVADISGVSNTAVAVTRTLTVPTGIRIQANVIVGITNGAAAVANGVLLSDLSVTDEACTIGAGQLFIPATANSLSGWNGFIFVNTSAQLRSRNNAADAAFILDISTRGWVDRRDQG